MKIISIIKKYGGKFIKFLRNASKSLIKWCSMHWVELCKSGIAVYEIFHPAPDTSTAT